MSAMELFRMSLAIAFTAVAVYSCVRLVWCAAPAGSRAARRVVPGEHMADVAHAVIGLAVVFLVSPFALKVPAAAGMLVFGALAAAFLAVIRGNGLASCSGTDRRGGRGGYNLHYVVACLAMVYLFAAGLLGHAQAPADPAAGQALAAPYGPASLTGISWLFGLYFLVAAASLGFRVAEPVVRVTHRDAVPAGVGVYPGRAATARMPAVVRISSSARLCAVEVVVNGGIAVMFFGVV